MNGYSYNAIPLGNKKEQITDMHNMNESQQLSANSREPWHKRLHAGWFDLCEITERAALKWQKVDQCLPRARGSGTGSDCSESKNVSRWWKHCVWWLRWWLHCCKSLSGFLFCTPNCSEFIVYKYSPTQLTKRKKNILLSHQGQHLKAH